MPLLLSKLQIGADLIQIDPLDHAARLGNDNGTTSLSAKKSRDSPLPKLHEAFQFEQLFDIAEAGFWWPSNTNELNELVTLPHLPLSEIVPPVVPLCNALDCDRRA
ncbi:MAG: hypothetical protein KC438_09880, partial [Thermomicrobiales bacterium]|nr:hypothetical protein [Thermomicrobiales bacterium]